MEKNRSQKTHATKDTRSHEEELDLWDLLLEASKWGIYPKMP